MENYKLYCDDCLTVMDELIKGGCFVDLTVTSPPYDKLRTYNKTLEWNFDIFKQVVDRLYKITKDGGIVVWVVGDSTINGSETGTSFKQALYFIERGFKLHDTMIFQKNTSSFPAKRNGNRYTQIFEYMFIFSKGKPKTANLICDKENKWQGHTNWGKKTYRNVDGELKQSSNIKPIPKFSPRNNIWCYCVNYGMSTKDKIAHKHPAIFPEQLAEDHILSWSNSGDIVFDCFMGSGTTGKMALLNNRKFIGIEKVEEYYNIAKIRIEKINEK